MVAGSARLCVTVWRPAGLALNPCAGMQLARLSGTAPALSNPDTSRRWDWSAAAALLFTHGLTSWLGLRVSLDVLVPLSPPQFGFYVDGVREEVFRPARVQLRGVVGLEWSIH
jgi:hypothetical protein